MKVLCWAVVAANVEMVWALIFRCIFFPAHGDERCLSRGSIVVIFMTATGLHHFYQYWRKVRMEFLHSQILRYFSDYPVFKTELASSAKENEDRSKRLSCSCSWIYMVKWMWILFQINRPLTVKCIYTTISRLNDNTVSWWNILCIDLMFCFFFVTEGL